MAQQIVRALRGVLTASLLLCSIWGVASANAASVQSGCAELQSTIDTASSHANHGEGEVVVLNGMCEATNLKSTTGVTIPAESNISIEGAPGTTSGFDGKGVEKSMLRSAGSEAVDTLAIRNLTFQHANVTSAGGGALQLAISHLTLAGDSFIENTLHGSNGGAAAVFIVGQGSKPTCTESATPAGATVTNTVFRDNKVIATNFGGGGALNIAQICRYPQSILEGNRFEGNAIELTGSNGEALGGAFAFEPGGTEPTPLIQRGNVFDSNHIISTSTTSNFGGGGEWTEGGSLTSIDDRFSRNTIPGAGSSQWSWGGGLGILNSSCEPTATTESTLEDTVVAANSIGAGGGDLGGGGIYVGCGPEPGHPNHLTLLNSTVTQNSTPAGGVPGIDGNPGDQLKLVNSIVAADSGGAEVDGFNGTGGSLSASFSDICAAGLTTPLPGEGNICANPLLLDNANNESFDVHETQASPTIDKGSNALVPSGLSTDFYGEPRIQPFGTHTPQCTPGATVGMTYDPALVDMGASELEAPALPVPALVCSGPIKPSGPVPGLTQFVSIKVSPKGVALTLSCKGTSAQICSGGAEITTAETLKGKNKKIVAVSAHSTVPDKIAVKIAQAPFSLAGGASMTVQLKLNKTGLALLKRFHAMPALVLASEATTNGPFLFVFHGVRFTEAKKHKKKKRHPAKHH